MRQDLEKFTFELNLTTLHDGTLSNFLSLKLDVSKPSALSVFKTLDLARANCSKFGKGLAKLGLCHGGINILDENIGLWIDEIICLHSTSNE